MIGFTKSFFSKQLDEKQSAIDSDEIEYGSYSGGKAYAEKISVKNLSFKQMDSMYRSNVWVRAIVDKIVERVTDVAPIIKPLRNYSGTDFTETSNKLPDSVKKNMDALNELIVMPNNNNETFTNIRKKISRDLLKYDAAAIEIIKGADLANNKRVIQLYAIGGNSLKLNSSIKGVLSDSDDAYIQVDRNMKYVAQWSKEKIMYFLLNPQSDRVYGLSPLESLIQTVTAELYASDYNLNFFYNNATPRFAVLMEGLALGQGAAALQRFRHWWDSELRGNPHRPIVIGTEAGKIQFQKVGMSNEEMQFQEYSKQLLQKIMVVYKMQPIVLGVDSSNGSKMSSEEQVRQFKIEAVKPHLTAFTDKFNSQVVFSKSALNIKDAYLDFDLDTVDKKIQAEWNEIYLKNGVITINEIRVKGLGMTPVPWGNVPYLQNNLVPFGEGKNGQAVPGNKEDVDLTQSDGNTPNANLMSRSMIRDFIAKSGTHPIGWEDMEISERLEIVGELIKSREQFLNKVYSFGN